jgi:hypothetical protein
MPTALANQIIAVSLKPLKADSLHPWLIQQGGKISPDRVWFSTRYRKKTCGNG